MKKFFGFFIKCSIFANFFRELMAARVVGEGYRAYQEKRYADAFRILSVVVDYEIDNGYVGAAQYIVAMLYLHGLGIEKNELKANMYLNEAANRRNKEAIKYLSLKK